MWFFFWIYLDIFLFIYVLYSDDVREVTEEAVTLPDHGEHLT